MTKSHKRFDSQHSFSPHFLSNYVQLKLDSIEFCRQLPFTFLLLCAPDVSCNENLLSNMSLVIFSLMDQCNNFVCFLADISGVMMIG